MQPVYIRSVLLLVEMKTMPTVVGKQQPYFHRWYLMNQPLTSDHDTQRPVWRQERDTQRLEASE